MAPNSTQTVPQISRIQACLLVALLLLVALVYWPGLTGGFVFDDFPNIVDNKAVHVTGFDWREWSTATLSSPAQNLPRPLAMLSFAINHFFTGLDPVPLKLTNIIIHLVNVLLVFGLARILIRSIAPESSGSCRRPEWAALLAAGCWALHPINLTAVLFVVQRMESLGHVFVFAGLWLYVKGRLRLRESTNGWGLIVPAIFVFTPLGVMAKESAALLPLYALGIELFVFRFETARRARDPRLVGLYLVGLALPAVLAVLWLLPQALAPGSFGSRDFTLSERLMSEARVVFQYFGWIVWPNLADLGLYHDDYVVSRGLLTPPTTLLSIVGLPIVACLAWYLRRSRPLSGLGLFWFFAAQVLTATFIPLELVFEHRNYFASLGICLLFTDLVFFVPTSHAARRLAIAFGLAALVALAGITLLRALEWRSPLAFAVSEAAKHPQSPRATYYLGWMFSLASGYKPDSNLIDPAFRAFQRARKLPNSNILPDQGALVLAARTGRPLEREWWEHMQRRLRERPVGPQEIGGLRGLMTCSIERLCAFSADDMLTTFAAALSHGPNADVLSVYANYVFNVLGEPELALRLWHEAHELNPGEPQHRVSVIKLLLFMGREEDAQKEINQLRQLGRLGKYSGMADEMQLRLQLSSKGRRQGTPSQ